MRNYFQFVLIGLIFFAVMEFAFSVQIRGDVDNFIGSIFINFLYFSFAYGTIKLLFKSQEISYKKDIFLFIFFGIVGLAIEWFLIGNSPWGNPDASQITMFMYWGGGVLFSKLDLETRLEYTRVKKYTVLFFIIYSVLYLGGGFLISNEIVFEEDQVSYRFIFLILFAMVGYNLMLIFYVWYILVSRRIEKEEKNLI